MVVKTEEPTRAPTFGQEPWALFNLLSRDLANPAHWTYWAGALACIGLFGCLFQENLWHFYYSWTTDENYSHGFLVPLIGLYFASHVARTGPSPIRGGQWSGSLLLLVALGGRLVTIPLPIPFLGDVAFLIGLTGLFTLLCGTWALKRYWFAFFFLIFMVPLPIALYSKIASPLQLLASQAASTLMNATGVPVLREGNKMTLPGGLQMFVAEACSGMRQLTGFLALTTAVAYLTTRPVWYRVVIMISALPIALTANIARVMLTGYIMHFVNPQFALGTYHTFEGLLMMGFGLLLLHCECSVLDQVCKGAVAGGTGSPQADRPPSGEIHGENAPHATLRRDFIDGPGGPGGPRAVKPDCPPAALAPPGIDSAGTGKLGWQGRAG